jgi:hypothetical protein
LEKTLSKNYKKIGKNEESWKKEKKWIVIACGVRAHGHMEGQGGRVRAPQQRSAWKKN